MADITLDNLCAIPTGTVIADRNSAILAVAKIIGLPPTRGALSASNHPFIVRTITDELLDGSPSGYPEGSDRLILSWFPIISVTAIKDFDGNDLGYVENTDYVNEDKLNIGGSVVQAKWWGTLRKLAGIWPTGRMSLKVSYTAGLATTGDIPAELSEAIRLTALDRADNPVGLQSARVGEVNYTYATRNGAYIPSAAFDLIRGMCKYRRL